MNKDINIFVLKINLIYLGLLEGLNEMKIIN